jgi:hypothetical protein
VRSRVGGNRTHTVRIKSPPCCQLHHDPMGRSGVCVSIDEVGTSLVSCLFGSVVALRIELSATRLSAVSGQPALDYRFIQVGHPGVEPRPSCSQSRRASICTSARLSCQSERQDLNLRSPGPRPGAITRLRHVLIEYPVRESNPCLRIESPLSFTVRRTGHVLSVYVR